MPLTGLQDFYHISITVDTGLTDFYHTSVNIATPGNLQDTIVLSDSILVLTDKEYQELGDTFSLSDEILINVSLEKQIETETLSLNDEIEVKYLLNQLLIDTVTLSDELDIRSVVKKNLTDNISLNDEIYINIPKETKRLTDSLFLIDSIETKVSLEKIFVNETIHLSDNKQINHPKYCSKIVYRSTNKLIVITDEIPAKLIEIDISGATPIWSIYELDNIGEDYEYAKGIDFNDTFDKLYISCKNGKVVKLNITDYSDRSEINVTNTDNLNKISINDTEKISLINTLDNSNIYQIDERTSDILNSDIRFNKAYKKLLNTKMSSIFAEKITSDLRFLTENTSKVNCDLRFLTSSYSTLTPTARTDFHVYIDSVEVTDVNLETIDINLNVDEKPVAKFILARNHDEPNYKLDGSLQEITDNNVVKIKIKNETVFTGEISDIEALSSSESISVIAKGEVYDYSDSTYDKYYNITTKNLPLPSTDENIHLYHVLLDNITIYNPFIDSDEIYPEFYKGIYVDLGNYEKEVIERVDSTFVPLTALEFEEFEPDPNYTYFWYITGYNFITNDSFTRQYIGTSLASLYSDTYVIEEVGYRKQRVYDNLITDLGIEYKGEEPYQEVSVQNGAYVSFKRLEDKSNGLYEVRNRGYDFRSYAQDVAEVEYTKIQNINGQVLPKTEANIELTIDGYLYYNIKLLQRINITNTTTSEIYKNNNGFPISVKSVNINSKTMKVILNCTNNWSRGELDELDESLPAEPIIDEQQEWLVKDKYDLNKGEFID